MVKYIIINMKKYLKFFTLILFCLCLIFDQKLFAEDKIRVNTLTLGGVYANNPPEFVKDYSIGIFGKVINFVYRVILLSFFVFSIVKIIKNKQNFFYNPIIFAGSYFILKSLFLSYTFYTATRHIVTSAIFIELFIIFFFVNKKNCLSKI